MTKEFDDMVADMDVDKVADMVADKVTARSQARPLEANQGQWEPTNHGPGSQPICKSMHFMSKSVKILRFLPALGENFVYEPRAFF